MTTIPNILVIFAHATPQRSRVNRRLINAVAALPHVRIHDLYETYPDFHIDVQHEQALLAAADLIVIQHPVQWYSVPALLKEWFDVVLQPGWAYGPEGNALKNKNYWLVATTGGTADSYQASGQHQHPLSAFLLPQQQTALLCGMRWLPPFVLHGAHQVDEETVAQHVATYLKRLTTYPAWLPPEQTAACQDSHGT